MEKAYRPISGYIFLLILLLLLVGGIYTRLEGMSYNYPTIAFILNSPDSDDTDEDWITPFVIHFDLFTWPSSCTSPACAG